MRKVKPKIGVEFLSYDDVKKVYSQDASRWYEVEPIGVFFPKNTEEVIKCVLWARREGIPLTARGGGSGLSGGAVPEPGGIVISTEKMRNFKVYRTDEGGEISGFLHSSAGAISGEIESYANKLSLTIPAQPSSLNFSTIGGNVATDSAGLRSIKYGSARDHIIELEVVLSSGDVVNLTGDDAKLIAGSEGTLGIIVSVKMNLVELKKRSAIFFLFQEEEKAFQFAFEVMRELNPSVLEFGDRYATDIMLDTNERKNSSIIVEFEEDYPGYIDFATYIADKIAVEFGGKRLEDVKNPLQVRKKLGPSLARIRPFKINEDICLPISEIPDFLRFVRKFETKCVVFGHLGVGILHTNLIFASGEEETAFEERRKLFEFVVLEKGGSLTGEHGIGISKQKFVYLELNEDTQEFMMMLKRKFDPHEIFNPSHFPSTVRGCIDTML